MQTNQKMNILLVDDRTENLVALESVLSGLGQNLVRAQSGREALRHLLQEDFAVILLDVQMPEMDGFETATLIRARERSRRTPIVFLTAINKSDIHVSRGYSVGAVDYVFKPFEPEILRAKVAAFVEMARKTQALEEEVRRRQTAEAEVRQLNTDLERRVGERTAELVAINRKLAREIIERKRAERERTRLFRELEEEAARKDEFMAMLAHELRNPLAAISNADYLLQEIAPDDARAGRLRAIISRQTKHLSRLVDDLLDISRVTRGKVELRKEKLEVSHIVHRAVEANRALIDSRGLALALHLPDAPICLDADATRLEQVLSNLLNNAAKYTEAGGRIDLTVQRHGKTAVSLSVRDTGVGLSPELLPRVFELFTQADRTLDRSEGGLGIGLALVKNLVQMHGGTVEAKSAGTGRGSEFIVRLPAYPAVKPDGPSPAAPCPPETPARPAPEEAESADVPGGCLRVLVLDDNTDAVEALADLITFWGHEVDIANDGPAALEAARARPFDVVFVDIGLPGMDGYEVARRLRKDPRTTHTRLVAISGYGQPDDRRRSEEAGIDMHLTKPVDVERLQRLITELSTQIGTEARDGCGPSPITETSPALADESRGEFPL